jgi:hypothetical protein
MDWDPMAQRGYGPPVPPAKALATATSVRTIDRMALAETTRDRAN